MMRSIHLCLVALCMIATATSAIAQEASTTASEFTGTDATLSYLSGAVVGTTVGLGTAYLVISSADCGESNMCIGDAAVGIVGGFTAFTFAAPLGIYWYGEYANLQGSYWSAFWGTVAGATAGGLIAFASRGPEDFWTIPVLATAGGVWSYSASTPDSAAQVRTQNKYGMPMVSYTDNNGKQLMLHLMGGQF